jgi:hypothetical protein
MNKKQFFILGALTVALILPEFAHAASTSFFGPIVPDACNCTSTSSAPAWGCVLATLQNVMSFLVSFATIIITFFIALAGFTYMTSGGNAEKRQLANKRLTNAVIGLLIVPCAYLLVDSIMKVIYNPNAAGFGPWNSILGSNPGQQCLAIRKPPTIGALAGTFTSPSNASGGSGVPGAGPAAVPAGSGSSGMNISAAVSYLQSHAHPLNAYTGRCGVYVRQAIAAGGLSQFNSGQGNAYQMGAALSSANFSTIYTGTYSSATANQSWQAGDVAVFQPVPNHPNGHITMYTGSQWVSDALQNQMASNNAEYQGGSFTVYRP